MSRYGYVYVKSSTTRKTKLLQSTTFGDFMWFYNTFHVRTTSVAVTMNVTLVIEYMTVWWLFVYIFIHEKISIQYYHKGLNGNTPRTMINNTHTYTHSHTGLHPSTNEYEKSNNNKMYVRSYVWQSEEYTVMPLKTENH